MRKKNLFKSLAEGDAITADEARMLMDGSLKRKGLMFRVRLIWLCGRINKIIEDAAEEGQNQVRLYLSNKEQTLYLPLIWKFYENLGFMVYYAYSGCKDPVIDWSRNTSQKRRLDQGNEIT